MGAMNARASGVREGLEAIPKPFATGTVGERFGAFVIDGFIVSAVYSVSAWWLVGWLGAIASGPELAKNEHVYGYWFVALWSLYSVRAFRARWCLTEGMRLVKIQTVTVRGTAPTAGRAVARALFFGFQLAFAMDLIVPLGTRVAPWSAVLVIAANGAAVLLTPKRQTIHDLLSGIVVVRAETIRDANA